MNDKPGDSVQIRKFNPGTFQSDSEVLRQFVVRNSELDLLLDVLRCNIHSPSCQHVLLVAPRGRGKTMMLARVAAELRTNTDLSSQLLPVRFMEESHEIFGLADFWLESLFYLSRELAAPDPEFSQELLNIRADLAANWNAVDLEDRARVAVLDAADRLDKRLVLMVENLQDLTRNVDDDFGWKLRKLLQTEPQLILLATATCRFEELDDAEHAFFELFRLIRLDPLDTEDCRRLWRLASGDTASARQIRPLQILTGGDPRLLIMIGEFARHKSLRQLMEELVRLVDDHTEYFRGHLEGIAKTERRVFLALIDLWQPSTTAEIALRARLEIRAVSSLLGRLVERGAVASEGDGRKRKYAAAQRLYSIYYKLRRERDEASVVRNLIHFMAAFYDSDELKAWGPALSLEARDWPIVFKAIKLAKAESPQIGELLSVSQRDDAQQATHSGGQIEPASLQRSVDELLAAVEEEDVGKIIQIAERILASLKAITAQAPEAHFSIAMLSKALAHRELGEVDSEVAAYDELIERLASSASALVQVNVAVALMNKAHWQAHSEDTTASADTFQLLVDLFWDCNAPELQPFTAKALLCKGRVLALRGDLNEAIKALDKLISRFGHSAEEEIKAVIATAMGNKENALRASGASDLADAVYGDLLHQFGDCRLREVQLQVAEQMTRMGLKHVKLEDNQAAIAAFDKVIERFGEKNDPDFQFHVVLASVNKGIQQRRLGDFQAAVATFDDVVDSYGDADTLELQEGVARAMVAKGFALQNTHGPKAAISIYDEVIQRFGNYETPELQVHVARASIAKGVLQGQLGLHSEALETFNEVTRQLGDQNTPELQEVVATALYTKGHIQQRFGDKQAAINSWSEVPQRIRHNQEDRFGIQLAEALMCKAVGQAQIGHAAEALKACDELDRMLRETALDTHPEFAWSVLRIKTKTGLLRKNYSAAIEAFQAMYSAFDPGSDGQPLQMVACVCDMIVAGISDGELVKILTSDKRKSEFLLPLIVALRQRTGDCVRAPIEILDVAADIQEMIRSELSGAAPDSEASQLHRECAGRHNYGASRNAIS